MSIALFEAIRTSVKTTNPNLKIHFSDVCEFNGEIADFPPFTTPDRSFVVAGESASYAEVVTLSLLARAKKCKKAEFDMECNRAVLKYGDVEKIVLEYENGELIYASENRGNFCGAYKFFEGALVEMEVENNGKKYESFSYIATTDIAEYTKGTVSMIYKDGRIQN